MKVDIDGTFDVEVNNRWPDQTMVYFKLFGHIVHSESYPKYSDGDPRLKQAVNDAKSRFVRQLSMSMKQKAKI